MTSKEKKLPFTQLMVSIMPKKPGIYRLWNQSGKIIYIGAADQPDSLFVELKRHFDNKHSVSIDGIYDFQVEVYNNPDKQKIIHLENFKKDHGYLPDFNNEQLLPNSERGMLDS